MGKREEGMGDGATTVIRSLNCVPWLAGQGWSEGSPPFVQCTHMYIYMYQDGLLTALDRRERLLANNSHPKCCSQSSDHYYRSIGSQTLFTTCPCT